jgi:hypothetical protein
VNSEKRDSNVQRVLNVEVGEAFCLLAGIWRELHEKECG